MKRVNGVAVMNILNRYFFLKLIANIFRPLKNIPAPDFNHIYDETIL
jgi:hypothetical protein